MTESVVSYVSDTVQCPYMPCDDLAILFSLMQRTCTVQFMLHVAPSELHWRSQQLIKLICRTDV